MQLTVAICTWNRSALLGQVLTRMRELRTSPGLTWELLVVNNNCTDDTDKVIAQHVETLPIRRLFEPKPGLSNARNCAIEAAAGDLLVFTDDDVLVETDWLTAYASAAEQWPAAGFFGGRITPWFEREPPGWLTRHLKRFEGMLVVRDLGPEERLLAPGELPFGANMAIRTALARSHRFDPALGKIKEACLLSEETVLFRQLLAEGSSGVWVPAASVRHFVAANRLTREYVWRYFHGYGRTSVRLGDMEAFDDGPRLWGVPRWLYRRYWGARLAASAQRLAGRDWVEAYVSAATWAGVIEEVRNPACT